MTRTTSISVIGSGNVAWHLAPALQAAGFRVAGVWSRTLCHARQLAERLCGAEATDSMEALARSDVYLFCVKDDALPALAKRLREALGSDTGCLFVHTAGSVSVDVLPVRNAAVVYPMMTFSKARAVDFRQISLFVEGSTDASLAAAESIARALSPKVARLDSARRAALHVSAVFACNFANHCFALGYGLLREAGIDPHCLLPLIDETAAKLHAMDPVQAQTGPAARADHEVMERHMDCLNSRPPLREIYRLMSESISLQTNDKLRPE